jgi:sRNA-binding regulator protein Hfq
MNDLTGPSISEIKQFIKNKTKVELYTLNDKVLKGEIIWVDNNAFHIKQENGRKLTVQRNAVIYYGQVQD